MRVMQPIHQHTHPEKSGQKRVIEDHPHGIPGMPCCCMAAAFVLGMPPLLLLVLFVLTMLI
jgi:hypothetical protein